MNTPEALHQFQTELSQRHDTAGMVIGDIALLPAANEFTAAAPSIDTWRGNPIPGSNQFPLAERYVRLSRDGRIKSLGFYVSGTLEGHGSVCRLAIYDDNEIDFPLTSSVEDSPNKEEKKFYRRISVIRHAIECIQKDLWDRVNPEPYKTAPSFVKWQTAVRKRDAAMRPPVSY